MDASEQCVIVVFRISGPLGSSEDRRTIDTFQERLAVTLQQDGEVDGDEYGPTDCKVYIYGESADRLLDGVLLTLNAIGVRSMVQEIVVRYGPPGAAEKRVGVSEA